VPGGVADPVAGRGSEAAGAAFRCGTIAVLGRPNVGKSTLVNALVGSHVSITSDKPQTTRNRVTGVLTRADAQFIFVDTPGLQFRHRSLLTQRMNAGAGAAASGVDAVVMVIDAHGWQEGDDAVLRLLPQPREGEPGRVVLALNKTDLVRDKAALLPLLATCGGRYPFQALVPVSAGKRWQLEELLAEVRALLPEGPALYDEDAVTDRSVRFLAGELVREQAFRLLGDELPYGLAVRIERWEENEGRALVSARILVERASQRPIVIGEGGAKLREIGTRARHAIEHLLGKPVFLETHVGVAGRWNNDARALDRLEIEGGGIEGARTEGGRERG
jgi:GTP-binding protein Era